MQNAKFIEAAGLPFDIGTGDSTSAGWTWRADGQFTVQDNALCTAGAAVCRTLELRLRLRLSNRRHGEPVHHWRCASASTSRGISASRDGNATPYGYYQMTGGVFNSGNANLYISNSAVGIWYLEWRGCHGLSKRLRGGSASGVGLMNVSGGGVFTVAATTANTQGLFVGNSGLGRTEHRHGRNGEHRARSGVDHK